MMPFSQSICFPRIKSNNFTGKPLYLESGVITFFPGTIYIWKVVPGIIDDFFFLNNVDNILY